LFLRTTPEKGTAKLNSNIQFANFFNKCEGKRRRRGTTEVQKYPFSPGKMVHLRCWFTPAAD
jgi:hypothetical protein